MKPAAGRRQEAADREGLVERVTFHNPENGVCVLRTRARGHRDLVTVVGHAAMVAPGEWITSSGEWVNDRTHGQQFRARFIRTAEPSSVEGIEKYLGSGMIRGIGPVYARKLVRAFGEKVFDVIEAEPEHLREVTGIGRVRAKRITDAWAEQKVVREIMVFLHSHGVGTARAVRIFRTYGAEVMTGATPSDFGHAAKAIADRFFGKTALGTHPFLRKRRARRCTGDGSSSGSSSQPRNRSHRVTLLNARFNDFREVRGLGPSL